MSLPIMKSLGVALFAGMVFARAGAANAFEITQGIPNTNQTACVDVQGDQTVSGTPLDAYPCKGSFNEQWSNVASQLQGLGSDASGSNCADASGGLLILDACGSPPPYTWYFRPTGEILNLSEAKCLDSQSQYGAGAQIALTTCEDGEEYSQTWVVKDIVFEQAMPGTDEHACVDVQDLAIKNDTSVNAYPCTFGINERWTYNAGQLHGIGTSNSNTTCLGAKKKKGVLLVVLQTCDSSNVNQDWWMIQGEDSSGDYGVLIEGPNGCLDSQGYYGNVQLVINPSCSGNTSELWAMR